MGQIAIFENKIGCGYIQIGNSASHIITKMEEVPKQESFEDSNDFYSVSNFAPLEKRQTVKKSQEMRTDDNLEKIHALNYSIVEELSLVTPLDLHPKMLFSEVATYYYQRKLTSVMEPEAKKREREKMGFIGAFASLFRRSLVKIQNKFTIVLPKGGVIYFFSEEQQNHPRLLISHLNYDFVPDLEREKIKFRKINLQDYERERLLIEGQYIRLFFGYLLNWLVKKNQNIEVFSNFLFQYSFREPPMVVQFEENRSQYDHLRYESETVLGMKKSKLYLLKFQSVWYKEDILKIEEKLRQYESEYEQRQGINSIQHELQFKVCKFTANLDPEFVGKWEEDERVKREA